MPWTTPETFTAGQTLTAASMNAISGNLTELQAGRTNAKTPSCVLVRTSLFTMASANTDYSVTFAAGNDVVDTDTMHNTSTNTDRITITTAGVYCITASCQFAAPNFVGSSRSLWIDQRGTRNGTIAADVGVPVSGEAYAANLSIIINTTAADYFRMFVRHNDNVSRDVVVTTQPITFSATWLGPNA